MNSPFRRKAIFGKTLHEGLMKSGLSTDSYNKGQLYLHATVYSGGSVGWPNRI